MTHCTPQWVDDAYGCYWKGCLTMVQYPTVAGHEHKHPPVPAWYTNKRYDRELTWWQFFVRSSGFEQAMRQRASFLQGFSDCRGNWWCGSCYWHSLLIDLGECLHYPVLVPYPQIDSGYAAWLHFDQQAGTFLVENAVRLAQALVCAQKVWQRTHLPQFHEGEIVFRLGRYVRILQVVLPESDERLPCYQVTGCMGEMRESKVPYGVRWAYEHELTPIVLSPGA